jgi:hypothetical protein
MKLASALLSLVSLATLTGVSTCSHSALAMPVAALAQTPVERIGYICDTRDAAGGGHTTAITERPPIPAPTTHPTAIMASGGIGRGDDSGK